MKKLLLFLALTSVLSCNFSVETSKANFEENKAPVNKEILKDSINTVLEEWHKAAAEARFEKYFDLMTQDGVFLGTDATENWQNKDFRAYAKPHFDKGKAWSFSTLERNIYTGEEANIAWFDELLDTQMGICRGSGVVVRTTEGWKIKHYVLSISIPNENVSEITELKKDFDEELTSRLK
ncbi:nuclear transport factor 2 family protein [Antarcticibacterium sp. 1MA-6-2]|uniref:nuclear transport factor 2 family protein n=1 Tax=Antarcticibacterium sp. 1MA-6-2 TaxID=2908210 RepID=UPI001F1D9CC5|nr:nuclear transport factor 2 family protein [Antarcticibacterium sp. 1MA-6-2]UJH90495.1 nuclear transport factor 2 family protein [Antarcticibacterium sp. 1MA-6-2]